MPTYNNAVALGVEKYLGQIAPGLVADVVMFRKSKVKELYRAVIDAENEDVMLVTMNGNRIFGDSALMDSGEEFEVCETKKKFDFTAAKAKSEIASFAAIDAACVYDLFFCGTPKDEPTCVPSRTRNEDTGKQQTTNYTGDYTASDDADGDGIKDDDDNCPTMFNPVRPMDTDRKQVDTDGDTIGDICDEYPACAANNSSCGSGGVDADGDTIPDADDNCPETKNADQNDADDDGIGDACDPCPNGDGSCGLKSHTLDFSCTSCKNGTGYNATYQETIDGAVVSAVGNVGKYQETLGITLTGDPDRDTYIDITNISGVGSITIKYISYNPTRGQGTLHIESGSFASELVHTYDKNAVVEVTTDPYIVNDETATSISIVPEKSSTGGKAADHRIHITGVTWTSFE
ncbi:MAG: thrombospondin type 3 repeat-containing protein [Proteobacteria bacterium]|nr:thrombospondin type 3 repeat-containing protein [Pseudomonadota bacterium]